MAFIPSLSEILKVTKLVTNLQDKLDAAATGMKELLVKHEGLDRRVYSLEERGRLEREASSRESSRELSDRARIDRLSERVAALEAQLGLVTMIAAQRLPHGPMQSVQPSQPPQLPAE